MQPGGGGRALLKLPPPLDPGPGPGAGVVAVVEADALGDAPGRGPRQADRAADLPLYAGLGIRVRCGALRAGLGAEGRRFPIGDPEPGGALPGHEAGWPDG